MVAVAEAPAAPAAAAQTEPPAAAAAEQAAGSGPVAHASAQSVTAAARTGVEASKPLAIDTPSDQPRQTVDPSAPARPVHSRADAVLAEAVVVEVGGVGQLTQLALSQSDAVLHRLDELQRYLLEESESQHKLIGKMIAATGGLSVGYVIWLIRGGVLVSSMLSALPAWQLIDPLPVLAAAGAMGSARGTAKPDEDVEHLFDGSAPPPPPEPAPEPEPDAGPAPPPHPGAIESPP
jgi:hypothetical protein